MVTMFQALVVIAIITVIFLFVKLRYIKHKLSWIVVLLLVLLFYVGFLASTAGHEIDLNSFEGTQTAIKLYFGWLATNFVNLRALTANAVKMDWNTNFSVLDRDK